MQLGASPATSPSCPTCWGRCGPTIISKPWVISRMSVMRPKTPRPRANHSEQHRQAPELDARGSQAPQTHKGPPLSAEGLNFLIEARNLAGMLLLVVGLCLREIGRRVLHELGHGLFAAEAVGLAIKLRIDGAVSG